MNNRRDNIRLGELVKFYQLEAQQTEGIRLSHSEAVKRISNDLNDYSCQQWSDRALGQYLGVTWAQWEAGRYTTIHPDIAPHVFVERRRALKAARQRERYLANKKPRTKDEVRLERREAAVLRIISYEWQSLKGIAQRVRDRKSFRRRNTQRRLSQKSLHQAVFRAVNRIIKKMPEKVEKKLVFKTTNRTELFVRRAGSKKRHDDTSKDKRRDDPGSDMSS